MKENIGLEAFDLDRGLHELGLISTQFRETIAGKTIDEQWGKDRYNSMGEAKTSLKAFDESSHGDDVLKSLKPKRLSDFSNLITQVQHGESITRKEQEKALNYFSKTKKRVNELCSEVVKRRLMGDKYNNETAIKERLQADMPYIALFTSEKSSEIESILNCANIKKKKRKPFS